MKGSDFTQPQAVLPIKLSSLTACIRLALGIAVTSIAFVSPAHAEGTKQWAPLSSHFAALGVMETGSSSAATYPFAGYNQPAERRLHIHIDDPANEIVYIGLGNMTGNAGDAKTANYYWRIKAPDGTIVHGANMAGGASSNITSHAQAVAGPNVLNASGYSTSGNWTFDPAAAGKGPGDYYIEFDINNDAATVGSFTDTYNGVNYTWSGGLNINWFDITVATKGASPQAIDGRVWSKSWGVRTNDPAVFPTSPFGTPFNGSMYAYDSKNFVTKIDFLNSGLRPLQGQFSFNETGPGSSGNKEADRKSVDTANQTNPQHKIFLNAPDTNVYPLGAEGALQNLPLSIDNINNTNIKVNATEAGSVEIVLDINGDGSFTAGVDRRLFANVAAGVNYVTWDGKDGTGAKVPKSSYPIDVMIAYTQGETHFTAYDVEGLDTGFQVSTQTSTSLTGPNLLFWDDSNIADATSNTPDRGQVNTDTGNTLRRAWSNNAYGDLNTINTWWFAYRDYQSTVLVVNNQTPDAVDDSATTDENTVLNGTTILVNDTDPDSDALTVNTTPVTPPAHGTLVLNSNGTYTYTPDPGYSGTDSFVYEISDGYGGTDTATVNITINSVNDIPVAADDSGTTDEDTPLNGTAVLANDSDADGDTLIINTTPVTSPGNGTVTINPDGTYTYTPNPNFNGTDTFEYEISDGNGGTDTAVVTITVNPVNDPPVAVDDSGATDEDAPLNGTTVLANDSDADGDTLIINTTPVTNPANGTVVINPDGSYTYTSAPNFNGTDSFEYSVSDGNGGTDTAIVTITVNPMNDDPVAANDSGTTPEDTVLNGTTVLVNDSDVDGDTLTVTTTPVTPPTHGTLTLNTDGTYTYTPNKDYNGTDSFVYEVTDGNGGTATATVDIIITPVNDKPVITSTNNVTFPENGTGTVLNVESTDAEGDTEGAGLTYTLSPLYDGGLFTIDPNTGEITFNTPPDYENPQDTNGDNAYILMTEVCDSGGLCTQQVEVIVVTNVVETSPPSIISTIAQVPENQIFVTDIAATDPDPDTLTFSISGGADAALFTIDPNTGELSFVSAPDFENPSDADGNNKYELVVMVTDNTAPDHTDSQSLQVVVTNINEAPVITSDGANSTAALDHDENSTLVTTVTSTDPDAGDTAVYTIQGGADAKLFTIDPATGELSFKTAPDFENPADSNGDNVYEVQVMADDFNSLFDLQTLNITVKDINDAPVITSDGGGDVAAPAPVVDEGTTAVTIVVSTDQDGDTPTYNISGGADAALFMIDPATGELTFKAAPNFDAPQDSDGNNTYEVEVTVDDGNGSTDVQTLLVNVADVNEAPVITSDGGGDTATPAPSVEENTTAITIVVGADQDAGDTLTYSISGGADATLFSIDPTTGELNFVAAPDFENPADTDTNNVYEVEVTVDDGNGGTDAQTLFVSVTDANEAPVITSNGGGDAATPAPEVTENTTDVTTVAADDPDAGDTPTFGISGGADAALFTIDPATGELSFVSAPDFENPADANTDNVYEVEVTVDDGNGGTDVQTLSITVTDANDAPVITSDGGGDAAAPAPSVDENTTAVTTVTSTDQDGDTPTYSIAGGADAALFTVNPATGALSFVTAPDLENPADVAGSSSAAGDNVYEVTVKVDDGNGGMDEQTLSVTVLNVNDPPVITSDGAGETAALTVNENQVATTTVKATDDDGDTLSYALSGGVDVALFAINNVTGELVFVDEPNFENPLDVAGGTSAAGDNIYEVEVTVSDGKGGTDVQLLSITVADINEAPVVTSDGGGTTATVHVPEEQTAVTTVTATDEDTADTQHYTVTGGPDDHLFTIDPATGVLSFNTAPDYENPADADHNNAYVVEVTVDDGNGGYDVQTLTVIVDNVNDAPVITSNGGGDTAHLTVAENNTPVTTVTATDADADTLAFSIVGGEDAALFHIDPATGVLTFITAPDMENPTDANGDNTYLVNVMVEDGNGGSDTQALEIVISNTNEAPEITSNGAGTTAALTMEEGNLPVTTVTSTDPDGDTPTYSISGGTDGGLFTLNPATGELGFTTAPDFENPADSDGNNIYEVTVTVTDAGGKQDAQTLTITVTDDRKVVLNVRAFLQGAYSSSTGLMADNLRTLGILPMNQPYAPSPASHAGTETLNLDVATVEGNNAIVDWMLVDLRDAAEPKTILKTQAVMVQRDGDLVDAQSGSDNIAFADTLAGDYFVSVRHRNHLGVMTAAAVHLTDLASMVDFTLTATPTYGSHARIAAGSTALLWAGDANQTQQVIAHGQFNDVNMILGNVLVKDGKNLDANANYRLGGYEMTDINMDGVTLYAGPGNDINLLLGNVLLHPANSTFAANFIVNGTLPK